MRAPTIVHVHQPERTEYVTRTVNVHEHRAPTDQSVALLKEMEKAATDKIVESMRVTNSDFEAVIQWYWDVMNDQTVGVAVFSIGGTKLRAEHRGRVDRMEQSTDFILALRDAMAKEIANHILGKSMPKELPGFAQWRK